MSSKFDRDGKIIAVLAQQRNNVFIMSSTNVAPSSNNTLPLMISGTLVVALMLVMSLAVWSKIPGEQLIAIHWGISGRPDGYAPKAIALFMFPAVMVLATIGTLAKQRGKSLPDCPKWALYLTWYAALAFMLALHGAIVALALGYPLPITRIIVFGIGLLLIISSIPMFSFPEVYLAMRGVKSSKLQTNCTRVQSMIIATMGLLSLLAGPSENLFAFTVIILAGVTAVLAITFYAYLHRS